MSDTVIDPGLPAVDGPLERVEAIARLRGINVADLAHARILDLGCAGGARALMWAECYPGSTILAVDHREAELNHARSMAAALGLSNIEFRFVRFGQEPLSANKFDYIVCQRGMSQSDDRGRKWIAETCRTSLSQNGVAMLGYDAFPGWHVFDMLRRTMLYEARDARTPEEKIVAARRLLEFLKRSLAAERSAYDALVLAELDALIQAEDWWLWHEYLQPVTRPLYLRQFLAEVEPHGLAYLGDSAVGVRYTDRLGIDAEQMLAGDFDELIREEYRDILRNRPARLTLVCHKDVTFDRSMRADRFPGLYLMGQLTCDGDAILYEPSSSVSFVSVDGRRVSTKAPMVKTALVHLTENWPRAIEFEALVSATTERVQAMKPAWTEGDAVDRLRDSLVECCESELILTLGRPFAIVTEPSARPVASPLARLQAQRGPLVVNRRHVPLRMELFDQYLLMLLDGSRDAEQLLEAMVDNVIEGKIAVEAEGKLVADRDRLRAGLRGVVERSLVNLGRNSFLIG